MTTFATIFSLPPLAALSDFEPELPALESTLINPLDTIKSKSNSSLRRQIAPLAAVNTCSTCNRTLDSTTDFREHVKSDLHLYNLKRALRALTPVSEEVFDTLSEISSISASDGDQSSSDSDSDIDKDQPRRKVVKAMDDDNSDSSDDDERGSDDDPDKDNGVVDPSQGPFVAFKLASDHTTAVSVYRRLLIPQNSKDTPSAAHLVETLKSLASHKTWLLIMISSGHFAGSIVQVHSGKFLKHKTFHRYTQRKKQGKAQSANDNAKGFANSAGASLRRYNQTALAQEVAELLDSWKVDIEQCDLVFVHAAGSSNKKLVFRSGKDSSLLRTDDPRTRFFPFTTRRPTQSELLRAFNELISVRIGSVPTRPESSPSATTTVTSDTNHPHALSLDPGTPPSRELKSISLQEQEPHTPISAELTKLLDLCHRGKSNLFLKLLSTSSSFTLSSHLPHSNNETFLHIASRFGHSELVRVLLFDEGCDPCPRNGRNQTAYDVAKDKEVRNVFRRAMAAGPERFDWVAAKVPSPLNEDMEAEKLEKERQRKKQEREKKKERDKKKKEIAAIEAANAPPVIAQLPLKAGASGAIKTSKRLMESVGMSAEARSRLDREKGAAAAEARFRTVAAASNNSGDIESNNRTGTNMCSMCGTRITGIPFHRLSYNYCSTMCVANHRLVIKE